MMVDQSVRAWAQDLLTRDVEIFHRARRRFLRHPTGKRLHAVRTAARRLRSLLEDLSSVLGLSDVDDLRRAIHASGDARDAAVLSKTLRKHLVDDEVPFARELLRKLRNRNRAYMNKTRTRLRRVHVEVV